ncbi:MAG TPA: oxygenase MpaB family protein [Verrucomicrobiae bacterium]|nr:oxygenase MpaB family protein [Verrucomicrobiae bacterium]
MSTKFPWASDYLKNYGHAKEEFGDWVDRYLYFTEQGDPLADALVAELAGLPKEEGHQLLTKAIEEGLSSIPDPPPALRAFFQEVERVPFWVDWDLMKKGSDTFFLNANLFLMAFVAHVLPVGFCTNINKPFLITGRLTTMGPNRLRANNRQLVESFMPDGLRRFGDGYKLSLRVRVVHAQVRRLLQASPEWDRAAWGLPLHSAHMAYAYAAFSAVLFNTARNLGADVGPVDEAGFMAVWRYQGFLLGVPVEFLVSDVASGLRIQQVGWFVEPGIDDNARLIVNAMVHASPIVAGVEDPEERRNLSQLMYNVSRGLIGDEIADDLNFPRFKKQITPDSIRLKTKARQLLAKLTPHGQDKIRMQNLETLFTASAFQKGGFMDYSLPQHVKGWIQHVD